MKEVSNKELVINKSIAEYNNELELRSAFILLGASLNASNPRVNPRVKAVLRKAVTLPADFIINLMRDRIENSLQNTLLNQMERDEILSTHIIESIENFNAS